MKAYITIAALLFGAMACRAAWRLERRHSPDDFIALVLWTAMMTWGVILL